MPRPVKTRMVINQPCNLMYIPSTDLPSGISCMKLPVECMEAIRLIDAEGMNQAQAARIMNVSRQTFGRILSNARTIVAKAFINGNAIQISGGNYQLHTECHQKRHRKRCFQHKQKEVNIMPNRDGTGPANQGKGSGQGRGNCNSPGTGQGGRAGGCRGGNGRGCGQGQGQGQGRGRGQGK